MIRVSYDPEGWLSDVKSILKFSPLIKKLMSTWELLKVERNLTGV
jgi:hypothetical protein